MSVPYLACMVAVATFYHLPPRVLPAIQAVEGGQPGIVHHNQNGTDDLGIMQVNTIWIEPLAGFTRLPPADVRHRLLHDSCFNIAAAGAILQGYLHESRGNLLAAVGFYHSHTAQLSDAYLNRVLHAAQVMFGPARPTR
jgi:hypothetical protein